MAKSDKSLTSSQIILLKIWSIGAYLDYLEYRYLGLFLFALTFE
jgi:hypothetical protein